MKISRFETDLDLERNGVWVDIGEGAKILVARIGNPAYRDRVRALTKPFRRQIRNDTLPEEKSDEFILQAMSETVLLGWEGIEDDKGKEIKYSQAKALELLTTLRDFRELVTQVATEQETFRAVDAEEEGKS